MLEANRLPFCGSQVCQDSHSPLSQLLTLNKHLVSSWLLPHLGGRQAWPKGWGEEGEGEGKREGERGEGRGRNGPEGKGRGPASFHSSSPTSEWLHFASGLLLGDRWGVLKPAPFPG